jgi:hypothetical protein
VRGSQPAPLVSLTRGGMGLGGRRRHRRARPPPNPGLLATRPGFTTAAGGAGVEQRRARPSWRGGRRASSRRGRAGAEDGEPGRRSTVQPLPSYPPAGAPPPSGGGGVGARATVRRMRGGRRQRGRAPLPALSSLADASPSSASPVLGVPARILEEAMLGGAGPPHGLDRAPGADLAVARRQG